MSRKIRKKIVNKPKQRNRIWCREALDLARLIPPTETSAQSCFCCGHSDFGFGIKLYEIHDAYGRLVLCEPCLKQHITQLSEEEPPRRDEHKEHRTLLTYKEWTETAVIAEFQTVLNRMKARLKGGD